MHFINLRSRIHRIITRMPTTSRTAFNIPSLKTPGDKLAKICGKTSSESIAKAAHGLLFVSGLNNSESGFYVQQKLIAMYSRCGLIKDATLVFRSVSNPDTIIYNSIIYALGVHGQGNSALRLFCNMIMKGVRPDNASFLSLFTACRHSGLVDEADYFFKRMQTYYCLVPTAAHYVTMSDIYGRAGNFEEPMKMASSVSSEVEPMIWSTILSACRVHGKIKLADQITAKVLIRDLESHALYTQLGNFNTAAEMHEQGYKIREVRDKKGLRKEAGRSRITK